MRVLGVAPGLHLGLKACEDLGDHLVADSGHAYGGAQEGGIAVLLGRGGADRRVQVRWVPLAVRGEPPSVALEVLAQITPQLFRDVSSERNCRSATDKASPAHKTPSAPLLLPPTEATQTLLPLIRGLWSKAPGNRRHHLSRQIGFAAS
jgi:hypothetical protein